MFATKNKDFFKITHECLGKIKGIKSILNYYEKNEDNEKVMNYLKGSNDKIFNELLIISQIDNKIQMEARLYRYACTFYM